MLPEHFLFIGHRGIPPLAKENTISSFLLAMEHGADGIELDVQLTKDGIPIVLHDDTLQRTHSDSRHIADLSLQELAIFKDIPTLQTTFEALPDGAFVNIELKDCGNFTPDDLAKQVGEVCTPHQQHFKILLSSFKYSFLKAAKKQQLPYPIGLLISNEIKYMPISLLSALALNPDSIHLDQNIAYKPLIKLLHWLNKKVLVWTVNDAAKAKDLIANGADGIFTDDVRLLKKVERNK